MIRPDSTKEIAFKLFHGVVEDVNDPKQLGRVRVRCYGYHADDKSSIATEDLPWAYCVLPVTSASISGIGTACTGLLPGSFVVGFFRDGVYAQEPIVTGTIASITPATNSSKGFADPSGTNPINPGEKDIPRSARNEYASDSCYVKKGEIRTALTKSTAPAVNSTTNAPLYPRNQVIKTEAGHSLEVDNTPGKERVSIFHKAGSWIEILADGRIMIMSNAKQFISSKTDIEITAENDIVIKGRNITFTADDDVTANGTNVTTNASNVAQINGTSEVDVNGGIINLN
jgi:hypothetical protein